MGCHWGRVDPGRSGATGPCDLRTQVAEIYFELARANRREDFRWFALSQGVAVEVVEDLWRDMRALVGAAGRAPEAEAR